MPSSFLFDLLTPEDEDDDECDESDDDNLKNRCDRVKKRTSPREPLWKMVKPCDAYGNEI
jgi:hypothetical protein